MEVLCRLSYSGALLDTRSLAPAMISSDRARGTMMRMRRILPITLIALCLSCSGEQEDGEQQGSNPRSEASVVILTADGSVELNVELADTQQERATGLMGRESLEPFDGMAFEFAEPTVGTFWMKDTLIPLSIAFWDERGRIVEILDMEPCTADPCPFYGPGVPFVGAVEVQQGTFEEHGIEVGDRVELRTPILER